MSGKFLKSGVLGLSLSGLVISFILLFHYQELETQNFVLLEWLKQYDVEYNYDTARYYVNNDDTETAKIYFVNSLNANPLFNKSFVDLSEIYLDHSNYEQVDILLKHSYNLSPYSFKLIWRMAILSLWIEEKDFALKLLNTISKVDSWKVFDLAWRVFDDKDLIYEQMVNDNNIKNYLNYLISKDKVQESIPVWAELRNKNLVDNKLENNYLDFLIKNNEFIKAGNIWKEKYGSGNDEKMVWNGNFENKPIQNGFGWIIEKLDNVYIGYDWEEKSEGNYSLYIEFNGKENMGFKHVSKIVPVVPDNDYSFSYFIKTDDLTTRNGVYWNIYCYPNLRLFNIRSQVFTGSNGWKEYQEEISVPDDCNALIFILSREKSNKLDKFISGKVWIDDVELDISKNEIN